MHIGIAGPIASPDIAHLLTDAPENLPRGYAGAPLLATLIGELLRAGHRVSAFTLSSDMPLKREAPVTAYGNNFSITYCPMRPRAWRPNGWRLGRIVDLYQFERAALQQAIIQVAPDVIHAHWAYEFALAALATRIPHVVTCHDSPLLIARMASSSGPTRSLFRRLRVLMARKALREAKCVTAVSPYMRDEVQALTTALIDVVPNPVDDLALALARQRQTPEKPRLAMICNGWDTRKNPEPALLAFAELHKDNQGAELHLYGFDFGTGEKAAQWCSSRNISDGMVFHGPVPHRKLLESLAECDLLLHPSLEESFGMVIAEAMAMGLPVVAGESSGAVPWLVSDGGTLCAISDPNAIYHAINHAMTANQYATYSLAANKRVKSNLTASKVSATYIDTYKTAIATQSKQY